MEQSKIIDTLETYHSWKTLTMLAPADDLREDGFKQCYKFGAPPPSAEQWRQTPSLEDSDYSSSAPSVNVRLADIADDATSLPPSTRRRGTTPSSSTPAPQDPAAPSS